MISPMARCYYCGNNPVSHSITLLSEYIAIGNKPLEWISTSKLGFFIQGILDKLALPFFKLAIKLHILRYNDDISKVLNGRSEVIWEEARRRGIPMRQLCLFTKPLDIFEAVVAGHTIIFESVPIPTKLQTSAIRWLDDKLILKERLAKAKLPVPRGGAYSSFEPMLELFKKLSKPVILKPAQGSRGRHTTTFIYTEEQLRQAFQVGKQIARRLVIEEHLFGSVYRATIINGALVGVLRGDPPRITGDGHSTITELIAFKNKHKHPKVKDFVVSPLTHDFLARSNYTLATIVAKNVTIDLTEKIGISYGGFSAEELPICHPETKRILEAVGRVVDFPVMGFDFITPDITKNPNEQKWGIIECNSLPFIDLHHHPLEGTPINAAKYVWDLWE